MIKLYDWQKQVVSNYKGFGIVEAVTGSGKTLVGREIAKKVGGNKIIAAPTLTILDQWKFILNDMSDVEYYTFQTLCKKKVKCKLLIVDEAHRSVSPEYIKLYDNVNYKYILGLTATPNDKCIEKCGKSICKVEFAEANVCPFKVHFIGIDLSFHEQQSYQRMSYSIAQIIQNDFKTKEDKERLDALILKRRRLVYNAFKRIPTATKLIQDNINNNKKVLVICQRIDQANILSEWFTRFKYIPHIIYHSNKKEDLEIYKSNKVRLCISVGMLKEGFNDPDTDVGIIVSTTLSKSFNIQAIGRIIRAKPDKFADIYILLANETTDLKVLDFTGMYDFDTTNIKGEQNPPILKKAYYDGEKFSFSGERIWKNTKSGRIYMQYHKIIKYLRKIKPEGGSFTISDKGIYTKVNGKITPVYPYKITLQPLDKPLEEKINLEELLKE